MDTGADANFIDTTAVEENQVFRNLVAPCEPINMTMAEPSASPVITNTIIADIEYPGDTYHNEELLVAPTTTTDIVLSQKFLKKNQCCIECSTGTVTCQPQEDAACPEKLTELTLGSKRKNPPTSSYFRAITTQPELTKSWEDPLDHVITLAHKRTFVRSFTALRVAVTVATFS